MFPSASKKRPSLLCPYPAGNAVHFRLSTINYSHIQSSPEVDPTVRCNLAAVGGQAAPNPPGTASAFPLQCWERPRHPVFCSHSPRSLLCQKLISYKFSGVILNETKIFLTSFKNLWLKYKMYHLNHF